MIKLNDQEIRKVAFLPFQPNDLRGVFCLFQSKCLLSQNIKLELTRDYKTRMCLKARGQHAAMATAGHWSYFVITFNYAI